MTITKCLSCIVKVSRHDLFEATSKSLTNHVGKNTTQRVQETAQPVNFRQEVGSTVHVQTEQVTSKWGRTTTNKNK